MLFLLILRSKAIRSVYQLASILILTLLFVSGCDSIEPSDNSQMVVEGFFEVGKPLPFVALSHTQTLDESTSESTDFIRDATFRVYVDDIVYPYGPSSIEKDKYGPLNSTLQALPAGARFRAEILWQSQSAITEDIIPPPISIDEVLIDVPDKPVTAILIDTLRFDNPQVGAREGFIYLIDVTINWSTADNISETDSTYWIEARLMPQSQFSSTVLDVFLLTEEVIQENEAALKSANLLSNQRSWTGVYAVPVDDSLAMPPIHDLTVQLVRGTRAYADFAASRNTPERREPISNIEGAIGILAGIALDSKAFEVKNGLATAR